MAIKKSELYSSLWKSCDELRGGMDASQYKDYVLVLLFVKYVSDKAKADPDSLIEVPEGGSFSDMVALKNNKEIGDGINKIIARLAEANDLKGIIDVADFNDEEKLGKGKEMVDKLTNLVAIFQNPSLDFSSNRTEGDDILGDAYEYLMRHFATESGKSKGQFYTPAEVSRIMAKVIGVADAKSQQETIYDPTCGSGSLLLKAADEAPFGLSIYGQEKDVATAALARMNMILHGVATAEIKKDNTLAHPLFLNEQGKLKTFDYCVANPPFSFKAWTSGFLPQEDEYGRFAEFGIPPEKNGDYAFLLHLLRSMKSTGKGAIILPHGVLFRGNAEATIRRKIIERGYIKGIVSLPANLFYGTGIPACIIVLDKEGAAGRKGVFMIDASKGYMKDGPKNRLREQDLHKIVDVFARMDAVAHYARMVPVSEIADNDYNLNIPRYIDSGEVEDIQDIDAHLNGGIPERDVDALSDYWTVYPGLRAQLFDSAGRAGYCKLLIEEQYIRTTIFGHPQFTAYALKVHETFKLWRDKHVARLQNIAIGDKPKAIIHQLAESLLDDFSAIALLDRYDLYQHLMNYWVEVMQDDVYAMVSDGWSTAREVEVPEKKKTAWEGRLLPRAVITRAYFATEQEALDKLEEQRADFERQLEELTEEQGGEDGLLAEVMNDKGKVTDMLLLKRIKTLQAVKKAPKLAMAAEHAITYGSNGQEEPDELQVLQEYARLAEGKSTAAREWKAHEVKLADALWTKYRALSEVELKELLVNQKWMLHMERDVQDEMDRISHRLTTRITELYRRYKHTLPQLSFEADELADKIAEHLKKMGLTWN